MLVAQATRRTWITATLVLVACACGPVRADDEKESAPKTESTSIVVENAILKTMESTNIAAQVPGIISALPVKEGSRLTAGQEIGKIRDTAVKIQVERAKTAVDIAKKKQDNDIDLRLAQKSELVAQNEYQRAIDANKRVKDTYALKEIDRLKLVADRAQLEIERAQFMRSMALLDVSTSEIELRQSQELLERHRIVAPAPGMVIAVEKQLGEWVEPGTTMLKIVRTDRLRIEGFIHAARAAELAIGRSATIMLAEGPEPKPYRGILTFISPDANPVNSQVRVYLEVDNKEAQLRPGLRVQAFIDPQS